MEFTLLFSMFRCARRFIRLFITIITRGVMMLINMHVLVDQYGQAQCLQLDKELAGSAIMDLGS